MRYRSLGLTKPVLESEVGAASVFGCRALLQDAAERPQRAGMPQRAEADLVRPCTRQLCLAPEQVRELIKSPSLKCCVQSPHGARGLSCTGTLLVFGAVHQVTHEVTW